MPGQPKCFIAIGISIAAMAMSTFNTVRITQCNDEFNTLKEKTDLILDVVHLHEKHLHHLEEKLEQTNELLADLLELNIWFSSKVTDAIEKKFQSVIHHYKNIVKSAQHHLLAPGALPHDILDRIIDHVKRKNLVPFVKFASDLFQIEVSHLYTLAKNEFTLILHIPMVSSQPAEALRVPAAANSLQICHQHLHHAGCRLHESARDRTLTIFSNNFQH